MSNYLGIINNYLCNLKIALFKFKIYYNGLKNIRIKKFNFSSIGYKRGIS